MKFHLFSQYHCPTGSSSHVFYRICQFLSKTLHSNIFEDYLYSIIVTKCEKWEIFNIADFQLKSVISLFYESTIEKIMYIAFDLCAFILEPCWNAKFIIHVHFYG